MRGRQGGAIPQRQVAGPQVNQQPRSDNPRPWGKHSFAEVAARNCPSHPQDGMKNHLTRATSPSPPPMKKQKLVEQSPEVQIADILVLFSFPGVASHFPSPRVLEEESLGQQFKQCHQAQFSPSSKIKIQISQPGPELRASHSPRNKTEIKTCHVPLPPTKGALAPPTAARSLQVVGLTSPGHVYMGPLPGRADQ